VDRTRYSTIAHRDHQFCSPLSEQTVETLLEHLRLGPGARLLDVGCGKAQMLARAVRRYGASGVGIDPNGAFLKEAPSDSNIVLHASRVQEVALQRESFDAALCIGSTHAFGAYADALRELSLLVRPGGRLAVGEGYWKQPPARAYLEVLGGTAEEFTSHEGNTRAGEALGLKLRFAAASSDAEWDAYEGLYAASVERFAAEHPDDPDREAMLARSRRWFQAYRTWGRSTLGFGVYLFEKP
jgi:ubiquinone/menaquinone biosynthesis C-methylase UbiE